MNHSQDGGLACGGGGGTSCFKWNSASGTWVKSHTLKERRGGHVSWATASGVYLIGGESSPRTSEKLKVDGSVQYGFGLKYDTLYACSIPDSDVIIITGGMGNEQQNKRVSVYNEAGWQRDLTPLNEGRQVHACGSYINGGKKVTNKIENLLRSAYIVPL